MNGVCDERTYGAAHVGVEDEHQFFHLIWSRVDAEAVQHLEHFAEVHRPVSVNVKSTEGCLQYILPCLVLDFGAQLGKDLIRSGGSVEGT